MEVNRQVTGFIAAKYKAQPTQERIGYKYWGQEDSFWEKKEYDTDVQVESLNANEAGESEHIKVKEWIY